MRTAYPELLELSVADKLELVEQLWESIAASPEKIPVAAWQKAELASRKAQHQQNPDAARPWQEVRREISGDPR